MPHHRRQGGSKSVCTAFVHAGQPPAALCSRPHDLSPHGVSCRERPPEHSQFTSQPALLRHGRGAPHRAWCPSELWRCLRQTQQQPASASLQMAMALSPTDRPLPRPWGPSPDPPDTSLTGTARDCSLQTSVPPQGSYRGA